METYDSNMLTHLRWNTNVAFQMATTLQTALAYIIDR